MRAPIPLSSRRLLAPLLCGALLAAGCGVPRSTPPPGLLADDSTVPNLRRGQEALRDRIALEKEHVEALNLQLSGLRRDEERLYATFLAAEADYQLRAQDLAGVENDIAGMRQQLEDARATLEALHAELAQLQADLRDTGAEAASLRLQLDAAHALRGVLATQLQGDAAAAGTAPAAGHAAPGDGAGAPPAPVLPPAPAAGEPTPSEGEPAADPPATPGTPGSAGGGGSDA